jgi:hypothetical protein
MKVRSSAFYSILIFTFLANACHPILAQQSNRMSLKEKLQNHQWKHRVLLLCASSAGQADFIQQKKELVPFTNELKERDLITLEILYELSDTEDKNYLQEQLGISADGFTVVLIGKDGGVKLKQAEPVTSQTLFSTIDAMPMRRQEMKKGE